MAIGWLTILSEPSGAKIYVDGSYKGLANSSSTHELPLEEGWHDIKATLMGYEDKTKEVMVTAGDYRGTTLFLGEEEEEEDDDEEQGTLSVNSNPTGANVYVLNNFIGKTPVSRDMHKGRFAIKLVKSGYKDYEDDVLVEENKINSYFFTLEEAGNWWDFLLGVSIYGWIPLIDPIFRIYAEIFDKELTYDEWIDFRLEIVDFLLPLNALSKLFFGKNLRGISEEFGTTQDYVDLAFGLLFVVPAAKLGKPLAKLGGKGFIKLFGTKTDDAIKIVAKANVDDQLKLGSKLVTSQEGHNVLRKLIEKNAIKGHTAETLVSAMQKQATTWVLEAKGFTKIIRPKTIIYGLSGILGLMGMAYSVQFGTGWMAKEGIKEQFEIPLSDRMRDYRFDPTVEKLEIILRDIEKLETALPLAKAQIQSVAWLWPFTKSMWEYYAENIDFELNQYKAELELLQPPELIELPEIMETYVRDITDGDTVQTSLDYNIPGEVTTHKLPEYSNSSHASIRIMGIDAPEMSSDKGDVHDNQGNLINVGASWANDSKDALNYLDDKKVTLYTDKKQQVDKFGRVLAKIAYDGKDVALEQIKKGLASYYDRPDFERNKYINYLLYEEESLKAEEEGIGMWKAVKMADFKINITSSPDNAKIFIDGNAAHHNTPMDEAEASDILEMLMPGEHEIKVTKSGMEASKTVTLTDGDNGTIHLTLGAAGLPEEAAGLTFNITSTPDYAKLYLDGVALKHNTPMDQIEAKDVIHLFTQGSHIIRAAKGGQAAERTINVIAGDMGTIHLTLGSEGLPPSDGEPPVTNCSDYINQVNQLQSQVNSLQAQLTACQTGEEAPPEPPPEGECTNGQYKCIGTTRWRCVNGNWQLHEANSTACGYVPPPPPTNGKIIQSWTPGDFGDDDEQGAIGSAIEVDVNDDGSYSTLNYHNRKSGSGQRGTKIGETLEGWEVFQRNAGQMWIYTGATSKGFNVYYVYIAGM